MIATLGENKSMNMLKPRIGTLHGYILPTSYREKFSDAVGYAPNPSRYLPPDFFDILSAPHRERELNKRYLRRSRYPGSRFR